MFYRKSLISFGNPKFYHEVHFQVFCLIEVRIVAESVPDVIPEKWYWTRM